MNEYQCGALAVEMRHDQFVRWNTGNLTDLDLDEIQVHVPRSGPDVSYVCQGELVVRPGLPYTETITLREAAIRQNNNEADGYYDGIQEEATSC